MTLPRLEGFNRHWKSSPPAHVSIAAYIGIGNQSKASTADNDAEFEQLLQMTPTFDMTPKAQNG